MSVQVFLRDVQASDLALLFEQQLDPEATRMAAFPPRAHDEFMAHWAKCMAETTTALKTIVFQGEVAGNIVGWEQDGVHKVGYWLGRAYWGQGIASAALRQFLVELKARPLFAHVAKQNTASIRVLQKCGFTICGTGTFHGVDGEPSEELILTLSAELPPEPGT
jgi:RimJ/RimL family protein N-acetyltransferase